MEEKKREAKSIKLIEMGFNHEQSEYLLKLEEAQGEPPEYDREMFRATLKEELLVDKERSRLKSMGFNFAQARYLLEEEKHKRRTSELEECVVSGEEITIRTKTDGTILGFNCPYYGGNMSDSCNHEMGEGCGYASMINK